MKKHKRIRRKRDAAPSSLRMGILITVLTLIVVVAAVLMIPVFNVTEIYCEGNINLRAEEVISASQLATDKNILLSNIGRARRSVEKLPIVEEASVRRVFPDKICITITERTPAAYIARGAECVAVAIDGTVLEVITDGRAMSIVDGCTPKSGEQPIENNESEREKTETSAPESTEDSKQDGQASQEEAQESAVADEKPYSIPLLSGIEVKDAEVGNKVKVEDKTKFEKILELCKALSDARLINRTTYIDCSNMTDIRIIIEGRLDTYIGGLDNIEYRTKFLAEVIESSISAHEKVVMDYRGDDIYVRAPEDGKDRIVHEEEPEESDEDSDNETREEIEQEPEESNGSDRVEYTGEL